MRKGEEHVGEMQVIILKIALFFHTREAFALHACGAEGATLSLRYVAKNASVKGEVELRQH